MERKADCACGGGCPRCLEQSDRNGFLSHSNRGIPNTAIPNTAIGASEATRSLAHLAPAPVGRIELRRGPGKEEGKAPAKKDRPTEQQRRERCDQKCGNDEGSLGSTECELDSKSGLPTAKVNKEVTDKSPCTRPCVEEHEDVHVKHVKPICVEVSKCIDAAGKDESKLDKCLDAYNAKLWGKVAETECAAYTVEEKCLDKRKSDKTCTSKEGEERWRKQMKMVKCYRECFCKA